MEIFGVPVYLNLLSVITPVPSPFVAGVVGHKKFAYDVWGDTVNTASRPESSGEPGKINIVLTT